MKQIATSIFLFMFLASGLSVNAQGQFSAVLTKMENSLFGINYDSQNDDARLKRIEKVVYGESSTKSVPQRVEKLKKDLVVDLMDQAIKPKKDTFAEDETADLEAIPKADSSVNYPIVNKLEDNVFNKEFKSMDINKRLANLEQKTFKRVYNDDLNTRTERLKSAILPDDRIAESRDEDISQYFGPEDSYPQSGSSQNDPFQSDYFDSPRYNSNKTVIDEAPSDSDVRAHLSALEKSVLNKSFPSDPISNRLSRLEAQLFSTNFVQDDAEVRLDRLSSAHKAQKSSKKYDNNKQSQRFSTAVQIGAMLLMVLAFVL